MNATTETTATHIAGPWAWEWCGPDAIITKANSEPPNIAVVWGADPGPHETPEVVKANARLIAAAPDLLAFVEECARADSDCGEAVREAARRIAAIATDKRAQ